MGVKRQIKWALKENESCHDYCKYLCHDSIIWVSVIVCSSTYVCNHGCVYVCFCESVIKIYIFLVLGFFALFPLFEFVFMLVYVFVPFHVLLMIILMWMLKNMFLHFFVIWVCAHVCFCAGACVYVCVKSSFCETDIIFPCHVSNFVNITVHGFQCCEKMFVSSTFPLFGCVILFFYLLVLMFKFAFKKVLQKSYHFLNTGVCVHVCFCSFACDHVSDYKCILRMLQKCLL